MVDFKETARQLILNLGHSMLLAALLLVVGANTITAQKVADGIYYISHTSKWYLWPSVTTNTTTGYRYLTTYNGTSAPAKTTGSLSYDYHDSSWCHWVLKNNDDGTIQLINPRLNQYIMVRKFPKSDNTKTNGYEDRDIWLVPPSVAEDDMEYTKVVLNNDKAPYYISPKAGLNGVNNVSTRSFNSHSGDRATLTWSSNDNNANVNSGEGVKGMIMFWAGSPTWSFTEDKLPAPVISDIDDSDGCFTITDANSLAEGYTIRYTLDGSEPTATHGEVYSGRVFLKDDATVKAVVVEYGLVITALAEKDLEAYWRPMTPKISYDSSTGKVTLTSSPNVEIYYTIDGTEPTTSSQLYEEPFYASGVTTIKAIAVRDGRQSLTTAVKQLKNQVSATLSPESFTYDGTAHTPTITVTDGSNSEIIDSSNYDVEYSDNINAGTVTVTIVSKEESSFLFIVKETFTIAPRPLTITAASQTKEYGEADPELTYTYDGLVEGDELTGSLSRDEGEALGAYTISQGTLSAGPNYSTTYTSATLTITPKSLGSGADYGAGIEVEVTKTDDSHSVSVKHNGKELTSGTDYTWTGEVDAANKLKYYVTITGTGNYTGTITYTFIAYTPGYYVLHKSGTGYLRIKSADATLDNNGNFSYGNLFDGNGSSLWVLTEDGQLKNGYFYLNVASDNTTLYLSVKPEMTWEVERLDDASEKLILSYNGHYLSNSGGVKMFDDKSATYRACPVALTEVSWSGPTLEQPTVASPQLVTYLRAYYTQRFSYEFVNDANETKKENSKDRRVYATYTFKENVDGKGTNWDITDDEIIYNKKTSGNATAKANYYVASSDPEALKNHPKEEKTVQLTIQQKPFAIAANTNYLLYSIMAGDGNRYPYDETVLGDFLKSNGQGGTGNNSWLTEPANDSISWKIEADEKGFYSFKNVLTGRYIYYDEKPVSKSAFGGMRAGETSLPEGSEANKYKFRLLATSDASYGRCYYIVPYITLYAIYKSDAIAKDLYATINNNDYKSQNVMSLFRASNSTWAIYKYDAETRIRTDFTFTGPSAPAIATAEGSYRFTADGWYGRYIKESPKEGGAQRGLVVKGTYKDESNIDYEWELTGFDQSYIDIDGGTYDEASGKWTITTHGNADGTDQTKTRCLIIKVTTLPSSAVSGEVKVRLKWGEGSEQRISGYKALSFTILGSGAIEMTDISTLAEITSSVGAYRLTADTDAASGLPGVEDFSGVLDCDGHTISGLTKPLFETLSNATIRNLNLAGVNIQQGGPVGAIAGKAAGATYIYNIGVLDGELSSSDDVCGGIVGQIEGTARVINCFSYADIKGGTLVGGIVGKNTFASTTKEICTMVMNCMFYGNISGATSIAPVYNGEMIRNYYTNEDDLGLNNYNYFFFGQPYVSDIKVYNCALSAEERYLNRFEFFRQILNSNSRLAAWYISNSYEKGEGEENIMYKWVLDEKKPYPILKKQGYYPSVINHDTSSLSLVVDESTDHNQGKQFGSLRVNIDMPASPTAGKGYPDGAALKDGKTSLSLPVTDKNTAKYDFNYRKVQLPYYNDVGTGNYTKNRVVTGWIITDIVGGTKGSFTTGTDAPAYNFVDRDCTDKDLYSVSKRVFSQGAYYEVPTGVTAITIEPYWADCKYVGATALDMSFNTNYDGSYKFPVNLYTNKGSYEINGDMQIVYNDFKPAIEAMTIGADETVYDHAIVLVSNYQKNFDKEAIYNGTKPITVMSCDLDFDNEPDYCLFYAHSERQTVTPIRFDFITMPPIGQAMKAAASKKYLQPGIFRPKGWFEITNTTLIRFGEFEYGCKTNTTKTIDAPLILMGGVYEQFVSTNKDGDAGNTPYILIGGNALFNQFNNGSHTAAQKKTPKTPISVAGGDFNSFYLSGIYRPDVNPDAENAECYIDGGRFGEVAGAGMQLIKGDVTWLINGADIDNFYGGGINPAKAITGNISTTITNSWVENFYGGPKFGDMAEGKTVETKAANCYFGTFFGAGFGGNAYNREDKEDVGIDDAPPSTWTGYITKHYKRSYEVNKGISTSFDYEYIIHANFSQKVARFFVNYAQLSLAQTRQTTSTLTGCRIAKNFYGGGSLGAVNGDLSSTLKDCVVEGSVFGAGFSATTPTIDVMPIEPFVVAPSYDNNAAVFNTDKVKFPESVTYTWTNDASKFNLSKSYFYDNGDTHLIYTGTSLSDLGRVTGTISLNIEGNTLVKGLVVDGSNNLTSEQTRGVFGGGDASGVTGKITVKLNAADQQADAAYNTFNVYGGGNNGHVSGDTDVQLQGSSIVSNNVFGGGKSADVEGNTNVVMTAGRVIGNIYGGGELGSVGTYTVADEAYHAAHSDVAVGKPYLCEENTGTSSVTVKGNAVVGPDELKMPDDRGHVYGAGQGLVGDPEQNPEVEFMAYSDYTKVVVDGNAFIKGSVYGGSENGHVLHDTDVTIAGGQIGCGDGETGPYDQKAFVDPLTTIQTSPAAAVSSLKETSHWKYEYPYLPYDKYANDERYDAPNYGPASINATDGHTFYGNVFGGGSGYYPYFDKNDKEQWLRTAGKVEGNTNVTITGGHILTSVYGGNELTDVAGKCTVKMTGGTLGVPRTIDEILAHPVTCNLYGAGKGDQRVYFNQWTNVGSVEVEISGGVIYGSVFGGGEDGHVLGDVKVSVSENDEEKPTVVGLWGTSYIDGNIFGGGRGFGGDALTAGVVCGSVELDISGGTMLGSIYGGGRLGSVGTYLVPADHDNYGEMIPDGKQQVIGGDDIDAPGVTHGKIAINISGGTIGNNIEYQYFDAEETVNDALLKAKNMPSTEFAKKGNRLLYTKGGNVFAGCMGRLRALDGSTIQDKWWEMAKAKETWVNISGGRIKSNVYGGAEMGTLTDGVMINITGGEVGTTIGSGKTAYNYGAVYGGGKGSTEDVGSKGDVAVAGQVGGDVEINLNKGLSALDKGGVVRYIYGCNDLNGSPKGEVKVNVYGTQNANESQIGNTDEYTDAKIFGRYDVEAVYGGGNLAAYVPTKAVEGTAEEKKKVCAQVNIDGCQTVSIHTVYGGGNAACTPATQVVISGTYEIEEAFGGGNGKDLLPDGTANPGANVGFYNYSEVEETYATKDQRLLDEFVNKYTYGSGQAGMKIYGGIVRKVFGGSNTKGNVREVAVTMLEEASGCPFEVDEVYGGGKSAPMDAESKLEMACIPGLKTAYGGAMDAHIEGNVVLNITNGSFDRVFGGNNVSGSINGTITVNIEETGCRPVNIGQLYGGGNQAAYEAPFKPGSTTERQDGPTLNIRSFTSIGEVYGGGYGTTAVVTGDTHVNINEVGGLYRDNETTEDTTKEITFEEYRRTDDGGFILDADGERSTETKTIYVDMPGRKKGAIGAIGTVYGGGNAAKVEGNTNVSIGTLETIDFKTGRQDPDDNEKTLEPETNVAVEGVDIRGNIFGGGNNAVVTGNTNVTVGVKKE